jgi:uncharacterized membrane protein YdfJ with MMPL/SSD domain
MAMISWWGDRVVRWRWGVLAAGFGFVVFAALWGTSVFGSLVSGGFDNAKSESAIAANLVSTKLGRNTADIVILIRNPNVTVDNPAYRLVVAQLEANVPENNVRNIASYWSTNSSAFVSKDRHATYLAITETSTDAAVNITAYDPLKADAARAGYTVQIGGQEGLNAEITDQVKADIAKAESLSMPILLILLVFVFGSVVSALLPLVIGGIAIIGAFTALKVISLATDVSIFSINIVTIMGLGLAIDYGLFMVSRFREELRSGETVHSAVVRTMTTAGRTVVVSAVTIAVSLAGLLIFPQTFLRSMGFGGMAAVMIAALGAITVLPALMAVLGHRVDAWSVRPLLRRIGLGRTPEAALAHDQGFWYRWANTVMRRPVAFMVASVAILLILATPFLHVSFGGVDARVLPTSSESRQVSDTMIREFPGGAAQPIRAVLSLDQPITSAAGQTAVSRYISEARGIPGVGGVAISQARGQTAAVDIAYQGQALDAGAKAIVHQLRALPHPAGVSDVHVGGYTAEVVDRLADLGSRLPWMALIVALATFVLLFLAFGSVVVPIKAIAMNILSMAATFGVVTWIFQDGHLAGLLNFTPTGTIDATQPILVFAVVFGLSMDYEVFLLSRIREQYDRTGDNRLAVATGLQRTGRIITSAALLLMVVIGAFSTSSVTFIKLIGVAMFFGILIDATIVRSVLVPATMRVLGDANWWAPRPLRGFYRRYGLRESDEEVADRDLGLTAIGRR